MLLEIENVQTYYGASHVLQGLSLSVPPGRVVVLLGRNGMGKTTLIRSIMGLRPPHIRGGVIRYRGVDLVGRDSHEIARLGLAIVPQGRRMFPSLSVMETLSLARPHVRNGDGEQRWTVERIFELFPPLRSRTAQRSSTLSGGEQQMLAVARALMTNPSFLLADEPSEGLAPLAVTQLKDQLLALKAVGLAMLVVEQNLGLGLALADEVYIVERGRVVYHDTPAALEASQDARRRYLGVG